MTDHQLSYCNVCTRKHFDAQQGILCSLTGKKPDFTGTCPTFDPVPGADVSRVGKAPSFQPEYASLGKRFVNHLVDIVVVYFLIIVLFFALAIVLAFSSPELLDEMGSDDTPFWVYVFVYLVYVLYYTVMETVLGRTVGKLVTGTHVVDIFGHKPTMNVAFRRSITRIVPFEAFSFLGGTPRGWHDQWTDTYVVPKSKSASEDIFGK